MKIPLILKLKKTKHKEIALAQDILIEELYNFFNDAILHGGTAIWRCYGGNRFSEDIDVYLRKELKKINSFFDTLRRKGFSIKKEKISRNSLFSVLEFKKSIIRFEALFKKVKGVLAEYQTADGNVITVLTLTPETLVIEKINAYLKRRKIRDLYDVFYLLRYVNVEKVRGKLKEFLKRFKEPLDKEQLKALIISGLVPTVENMVEYIKRKIKWEK